MPSSHGAKTRQKMKKGSQRKQEKDHMNCWGTRLQQQTLTRLVDRRCNKKNISILDNPQTDLKNMRHLSNYFAVYVAFSSFWPSPSWISYRANHQYVVQEST